MLNFDPSTIASSFIFRDYVFPPPSVGDIIVLPANANRVLAAFSTQGSLFVVRPVGLISSTDGLAMPANSPPLMIEFAKWGGIVGYEWHSVAGVTGNLYVSEVIYYPKTE